MANTEYEVTIIYRYSKLNINHVTLKLLYNIEKDGGESKP